MLTETTWKKSTYSSGKGEECVEAKRRNQNILLRDSKNPTEILPSIPHSEWIFLIAKIKSDKQSL
ncbi:DUF397 domain-containing protein [Nocardiopsis composta]|uniref:DUF397 domain-containing protein n=1 Tax=Nocardiopsis composta TaxID=157465 RepID=UPI00160D2BBC